MLSVSSNFEGGNAEVLSIDQQTRTIVFKPHGLLENGWAYWWYLRVDGITPGETLALEVRGIHGRFAHPEQAAFSTDQIEWKQTAPGKRDREFITYRVAIDAETAWFAWGPPFVSKDAHDLVERCAQAGPWAQAFELTTSRGGRSVPGLRVTRKTGTGQPRYGVWIQARQHAWECGASWVAEGFAEWLVSGDARAQSLREMADVTVIPIMDMDSAALGLGGKAQKPQDHNRDWTSDPYWPEVRAAMAAIKKIVTEEGLDAFIDLHSPGMYDPESFYLSSHETTRSPIGRRNLARFYAASHREMTGPLRLKMDQQVAGPGYTSSWKKMSQNWVTAIAPSHVVSFTLETAWNNPGSTSAGYKAMGRQLGLALEGYLKDNPRAPVAAIDTTPKAE